MVSKKSKLDSIIDEHRYPIPTWDKRYRHFIDKLGIPTSPYHKLFMDIVEQFPSMNIIEGPWLAGGAVRRLLEGAKQYDDWDFDFFCRDKRQFLNYKSAILSRYEHRLIFKTNLADTYFINFQGKQITVQLVHKHYRQLSHLFAGFDFTNSMLATDGSIIQVGQHTLSDIKNRSLRINDLKRQHDGLSTFRRFVKFGKEGYNMSDKTMAKFLLWVKHHAKHQTLTEACAPSSKPTNFQAHILPF